MKRYRDFDLFIKEKECEEIKFKLYDKEWTLPAELPVLVILQAMTIEKTQDERAAFELLQNMLGKEQFEELCQAGLTVSVMTELMTWLMELYTGQYEAPQNKPVGK